MNFHLGSLQRDCTLLVSILRIDEKSVLKCPVDVKIENRRHKAICTYVVKTVQFLYGRVREEVAIDAIVSALARRGDNWVQV